LPEFYRVAERRAAALGISTQEFLDRDRAAVRASTYDPDAE